MISISSLKKRLLERPLTSVILLSKVRKIVGEDDGGTLFTPEQYEEYKRKVLPQRVKNRLYVSYGVPGGIDCNLIGPETQCFCTHKFKQHKTEWETVPSVRPLALQCLAKGCRCTGYQYVPKIGSNPVRCRCKHLPQDHYEAAGHLCKMCSSCSGFKSTFTCGCGKPSSVHQTLVETKEEREARGRPVGWGVPYAAMGGLTGFSSLLDGYLALEARDSERGENSGRSTSRTSQTSTKAFSSALSEKRSNKKGNK
ncbi:protein FAM221A isoform X1 [Gouania willdenowi]|uniref:protein FAM221A isoform X1 n=1 Tax=Gouania willdenowi TaxID=441366 RepID=UPI001054B396|nr:protein FAM221A isoform X1 [Gouania willdenowi]